MKSLVRRAVSFVIYFLLFSILINGIFLLVIFNTDWDFVKRIKSLRFDQPSYEVLVLGSSLCEYGIDTELMSSKGIPSFNLSLVGSSIKTNYIQLREYLHNYQSQPKVVILAVNAYLEAFHQEGIQPVVEFTMQGHRYGIKDVPVSKFGWAGMELLKKALFSDYRKMSMTSGHKKSIRIEPDETQHQALQLDIKKYRDAKWIQKTANLCHDYQIKLILIEIPGVQNTQNQCEVGPFILEFENGSSAKLYNFNSRSFCEFIDPDRDWSGLSHFNKYGAVKFTYRLLNEIQLRNQLSSMD
ncbi:MULTISPECIES: hypothetical protein [unclassified Carboxylicivirga]|uniref:hypothetical protein n=1 Tax=Carboxylicivirga TaxID=1628153 RepID=UPI003D3366E0